MDGSGSIGKCEFNNGKKAMKSLMQFKQSSIDAKYAMITFANDVRTDFSFLPQLDAAIKIDGAKYPSGGTNTQAALAEALKMFKSGMIYHACENTYTIHEYLKAHLTKYSVISVFRKRILQSCFCDISFQFFCPLSIANLYLMPLMETSELMTVEASDKIKHFL